VEIHVKNISLKTAIAVSIALTIAASLPAQCAEKTVYKDPSKKGKLVGKHMLSLQWLQYNENMYGSATIEDKGGTLYLKGEQKSNKKDVGYLKVDGIITEVGANSFKFNGEIKTSVKSINNGEECMRSGVMNFLAKGKRKYWRLQEMQSPCSDVTDYVDVYFK